MKSWLELLNQQLRLQLPDLPPAANNRQSVAELAKVTPAPLPEILRDFLLWLPIGSHLCFEWEIPFAVPGFFLEPGEMAQIINEWKNPSPPGTVNWWSPHWIPLIGTEEELLCLDLAGTFDNSPGALIYYHRYLAKRPTVFPSFTGWLRWLAVGLEKGLGRAFWEDGKLDLIMGRKSLPLYREHFPGLPQSASAGLLPIRVLLPLREQIKAQGLQVTCPLPSGLTQQELVQLLTQGFLREDGRDAHSTRVILTREDGSSIFANFRSGTGSPVLDSLVMLAEPIAQFLRNARSLTESGDPEAASLRLCQAAYDCHQSGQDGQALLILRRALQLHAENSLASRSLAALLDREVCPPTEGLLPLLQYLH